jgi:Ca2+-binding EF-hand superfamily protein
MSEGRKRVIAEAFKKLDRTGDAIVTLEDLNGVYNVKHNPRYLRSVFFGKFYLKKNLIFYLHLCYYYQYSGEETEEQILKKFLANFEMNGSIDGMVNLLLIVQRVNN